MTERSVFKSSDYKHFLKHRLAQAEPFPVTQAALARAAGVKASYLSQCLNGKVQLLPEQLHAIGVHLKLSEEEIEFLLLLLQYERSGLPAHRSFLKKRITEARESDARFANRLERDRGFVTPEPSTATELQAYYNDWFTIAVHMLCTLPGVGGAEEIARRLGLSVTQANQAIATLTKIGLIEARGGGHRATSRFLRITDQDPLIGRHHANWRLQAALRSQPAPTSDLHYTALYSLSLADAAELREEIAKLVMKVREKVKPSLEECVVAFGLDWFHVGK
jgi:uncharacterized protein (TIGR02147 family)